MRRGKCLICRRVRELVPYRARIEGKLARLDICPDCFAELARVAIDEGYAQLYAERLSRAPVWSG
jgi:hypothetical protein